MIMADCGKMILEMAASRDELAKEANAVEQSDNGDSKEKADELRQQITGMHIAMSIAIRYMGIAYGITFEQWKKMQADRE